MGSTPGHAWTLPDLLAPVGIISLNPLLPHADCQPVLVLQSAWNAEVAAAILRDPPAEMGLGRESLLCEHSVGAIDKPRAPLQGGGQVRWALRISQATSEAEEEQMRPLPCLVLPALMLCPPGGFWGK